MKVFILRHGMTADSVADELRQLSPEGVNQVDIVVRRKKDELATVKRMYSSPMVRVTQTLEIAAEILGFNGEIEIRDELTTGSRLNELTRFVDTLDTDKGDIIISSHQSCTSILVLWLTGEDILIANGSLLAIDIEQLVRGGGTVLWQESLNSSEIKRATNFVDEI